MQNCQVSSESIVYLGESALIEHLSHGAVSCFLDMAFFCWTEHLPFCFIEHYRCKFSCISFCCVLRDPVLLLVLVCFCFGFGALMLLVAWGFFIVLPFLLPPPGNYASQFLAFGFHQYFSVINISMELEKPTVSYMCKEMSWQTLKIIRKQCRTQFFPLNC